MDENLNKEIEARVSKLVDERIAKALGIQPQELEALPADTDALMSTPSVLSTVRATAYVMC